MLAYHDDPMTNLDPKLLIDRIYTLRLKRDLVAATHDDRIKALTAQLEAYMRGAKLDSAKTENASAYFRTTKAVTVADWAKLSAFVEENQAYDILQRRITPTAVEARLAAGEKIPGITVTPRTEFVVRALPKKGAEKSDEN